MAFKQGETMQDIKDIIAKNIIELRKKNHLTQGELAQKINYSDNAVSRWERGEVTPSIETLDAIAKTFNIPLSSLIEDNAKEVSNIRDKKQITNKLAIILICCSIVWLIAIIAYVYIKLIFKLNIWTIFVWAVPISCLVLLPFNEYWGRYIYKFVILSVFQWSILGALYLQCLQYNIWLIFIIGVPIQVALSIWAFIKPKNIK